MSDSASFVRAGRSHVSLAFIRSLAALPILGSLACASPAASTATLSEFPTPVSSCVRFTNESEGSARVFLLDGSLQYLLGYVDPARTLCLSIPQSVDMSAKRTVSIAAMPLSATWVATDRVIAHADVPRSEPWPLNSMRDGVWRFDGQQVFVIQRARPRTGTAAQR